MKLEKAVIEPEGDTPIPVLFNPTEFTVSRSNRLGEIGGNKLKEPSLQYSSGDSSKLTMSLFFDTFEVRADVRDYTDGIYDLLKPRGDKGPPSCTFRWGQFSFHGVLDSVEGRFTLFLPDGTPARATLSISFTGMPEKRKAGKASTADLRKSQTLRQGDSLNSLAAAMYGDPGLWRTIARANGITDPLAVRPGTRLTLPAPK